MKTIYILFLSLFLLCGNFLPACNSEKVNANVAPVVDTNVCYQKSQNLGDVFIDLNEKSTEGKIFWKDSSTTLKKGENEYEWVFEPKNTNKFLPKTGAIKVVGYESLDDFSVSIKDWTFGEAPNEPQVANNTGNGEVTFTYANLGEDYFTSQKPTDAGKYAVKATVQPTSEFARAEDVSAFTINKKALLAEEVGAIQNKIFTNAPQKPELKIKDLEEDKDYTVSWSYKDTETAEYGNLKDDFVSVGIYKATITGKCNYTETIEKTFQIFEDTMENQKRIQDETTIQSPEQVKQVEKTEASATETKPEATSNPVEPAQNIEQNAEQKSNETAQNTEQKSNETQNETDLKPEEIKAEDDEQTLQMQQENKDKNQADKQEDLAEKPAENQAINQETIDEKIEDNTSKTEQINIETKEEMPEEKQENKSTKADVTAKNSDGESPDNTAESKTPDKELIGNFENTNKEVATSNKKING